MRTHFLAKIFEYPFLRAEDLEYSSISLSSKIITTILT